MNARMILDRAEAIGMNPLEKLKLVRELKMIRTDIAGTGAGALAALKKMKLAVRLKEIRARLGAGNASTEALDQPTPTNTPAAENENQNLNPPPEATEAAPQGSATPVAGPSPVKKSASRRQKDNDAAIDALRRVKAVEADAKDPTIREALKGYSGSGGGLKTAQGTSGSPHEYYTPEPVAKAMWSMLEGMGFAGGKVLDPSAGMGVFARTKPDSAAVEQIELDSISGEINGLLNDGPTVATRVASFEEVAASTDDETFDAVVTNVPFGDKSMRGAHWRKDRKYQNANLQEYFILRGLEKIKPGGFAAFIVPTSVISGKGGKGVKLRNAVSMASEFVGAYRMPNVVFDEAGADVATDILILRKHGKANKAKIDELAQQSAATLTEAGVIWPEFVDGNYFLGDGKRFQIGETTMGKGKYGEVEKVAYTGSIDSIAALLKPFPKSSRINWALLDTVETAPIVYAEGDTVFSGGAMLQMVEGKLILVEGGLQNEDDEAIALLARFTSPLDAITQGLTFDDASRALSNEETAGRMGSVPRWLVSAHRAASAAVALRGEWFDAVMAGMAVQEFAQGGDKESRNYAEAYPELSRVLADVQGYATKRAGVGGELVAHALQNIAVARKRGAFTAWWSGNVAADKVVTLTVNESYAKIKLDSEDETGFVPVEAMRQAFPDFDPLNDDQWCVSPDGGAIMSAEDYYFGNYAEFLERAKQELAEATDPAITEKLLRQHGKALERITLVDPSRMRFSLESAFVSQEEKADFIKQYVSDEIELVSSPGGTKSFKFTGSSNATGDDIRRVKTLRRYAIYLNNKTITTGNGERGLDDPQEEQALLDSIKGLVNSSAAQFDSWCKSNEEISSGIRNRLNAPENLRFVETPNFAPVDIPNWNPAWVPHGYQYAAVRRFSKRFSGILGFDVGLGKAQPLDSKILTPGGWKRMGDIRVGDMVIAVDGTPTTVTGVFPQGEKEIFEVEFSDGSKTKCCDEHLWETQTEPDRKNERYARSTGKARAVKGSVKSLKEIRGTLTYQTQKNHKIPMVAPVQFDAQEIPIDPYVLGALIGDGHFGKACIDFACADDEMSSAISKSIAESGMAVSMKLKKQDEGRCKSFGITRDTMREPNNQMVRVVAALGLKSKLSHEKFVPQQYLFNTPEVRLAMLQGLMDTDGYVCKVGVTVQFSSSSEQLAKDVQFIVQSLGGLATIKSKIPTFRGADGEKKKGLRHYTVHLRLPASVMPFRLNRKIDRVKPKSKYTPVRYITSAKSTGVAPAQCISIDHPTHLYVTDDFIVTHNTLTALAAVQYCQSIGAKKKTIFVAPSATLTNWKKEAGKAYKDTSDCLFVGLTTDKDGSAKYKSSSVNSDLNIIRENRHSKIFMTFETLTRIPLREETLQGYKDYLLANDDSFAKAANEDADEAAKKSKKTSDVISSESAVARALASGDKSAAVPYFEDMGVDSLVIDEAHGFKNSKKTSSEFKAAKFIANPASSQRGMDMQAKCWYIRGITGASDGVMALTATPVTNSPSEIYSMLSLAIGEQELNAMTGATGCDSFMMNTCEVENRAEDDLTGAPKNQRTLKGIANLDILRRVLDSAAMIETPETVAAKGIIIEVPEAEEVMTSIELSTEDANVLKGIKKEYLDAAAKKRAKAPLSQSEAITASPFNAIRKMTKLITDKELHEGAFRFGFCAKDKAKAEAVAAAFNKLKITEERKEYELDPGMDTTDMKSKLVTDRETGAEVMIFYVPVLVSIEGSAIVLPAVSYDTHDRLMTLVEKAGITLSAKASPKTQALLANLQKENASPRWKPAKQIVFCDELALHHKLRLLIAEATGIPLSKICIVNAKSVTPDEIQDVQDGFNANEDENRYQIIIANKKAEVGINLQQGTQAIHHLTIGWTPDSIHQRNGRGVRQGNKVETPVMVYHYEANGTFDAYKRRLVSVKGDWIGSLMDKDSENVDIEGDLSAEDYARMAELVGDSAGMAQFNADMAKKAKKQVSESAKIAQVSSISVAMSQQKWMDKFGNEQTGFTAWISAKTAAVTSLNSDIATLQARADKTESVDVARRCNLKIDELKVKRGAIQATIAGGPLHIYKGSFFKVTDFEEDSAVVVDWKKDVALNRKMLDEARAAFETRATQGYDKSAVTRLDAKTAVILNGKIISDGDMVIANGKPGLVKVEVARYDQPPVAHFANLETSQRWIPLAGMTIEAHGTTGSEARSDILKMLVDLDEATIAAKGESLYARLSGEVRAALRSAIPSLWLELSSVVGDASGWVSAPNFPLILRPSMMGGAFTEGVVAAQAGMLEFRKGMYGRNEFRFKDSRNQAEQGERDAWDSIAGWMTANGKTMTGAEALELDSTEIQDIVNAAFINGIAGILAKAGSIAEFNEALEDWFKAAFPWLDAMSAADIEGRFGIRKAVSNARMTLDDGSVKYDVQIESGTLRYTALRTELNAAIVERFAAGAMNKELMAVFDAAQGQRSIVTALQYFDPAKSGKISEDIDRVAADALGGTLEGDFIRLGDSPFTEKLRAVAKTGKGAVPLLEHDGLLDYEKISDAVRAYAAEEKRSAKGMDMKSLTGLLMAIGSTPGIASAKIGLVNFAKMKDRFSGAKIYESGEYIRMEMPRGSELWARFTSPTDGLEGRLWNGDKKEWLINIIPAKFSDGKPVADILTLAKFLNIDTTPFLKK